MRDRTKYYVMTANVHYDDKCVVASQVHQSGRGSAISDCLVQFRCAFDPVSQISNRYKIVAILLLLLLLLPCLCTDEGY